MADTFSADTKQFNEIVNSVQASGAEVERVINDYIHNETPQKIRPAIEGLVPISDRNKAHAKNNAPFGRQENYNLAVKLITSKQFNYLVFPDEALGTSVGKTPQNFTGRGLDMVIPELIDEMTARVTENFTTK